MGHACRDVECRLEKGIEARTCANAANQIDLKPNAHVGRVTRSIRATTGRLTRLPLNSGVEPMPDPTQSRNLKRGKIKRQPCEVCGSTAQMHHDDYSRPLEVRWLCRPHHQ